jgi:transcriptional regulator with XRE-family HTH domain
VVSRPSVTLPAVADQRYNRARKTLSAALKKRRRELGFTQEDVADALGIVARHYQKIEAGTMNVTLETLARLSAALDVQIRDLF